MPKEDVSGCTCGSCFELNLQTTALEQKQSFESRDYAGSPQPPKRSAVSRPTLHPLFNPSALQGDSFKEL